jgi:PAS domain S-box-containing protein
MAVHHRRWSSLNTAGAAFAGMVLALSAGGYVYYRREADEVRATQLHLLAAVGQLKASQIADWRETRLSDARRVAENPFLRRTIAEFVRHAADRGRRKDIRDLLALERMGNEYSNVLLVSIDGSRVLFAATDSASAQDPATRLAVTEARTSRSGALSRFFRLGQRGAIHLDAAAAIRDAAGRPYAVVVLRSHAASRVFPLIQTWPTPSPSAESELLEREGDSVVFLNELRHQANSALRIRTALTHQQAAAVQAVMGRQGEYDGLDYRGVPVLADLRPIPGSPWFLVSKIDRAEAMAETRYRRGEVIAMVVMFTLLGAGALMFRRRQAAVLRSLAVSERGLREAQAVGRVGSYLFDIRAGAWTSSQVLDSIFGLGPDYPRTTAGWGSILHPDDRDSMLSYLAAIIAEHRPFEREYRIVRVSDGVTRWVSGLGEVSYDEDGAPLSMVGAIQDVTERKLAEQKVLLLNAELEERVQQRTADLQASNRELEAFAYSVSHDLRSPLRAVDGYARILEEEMHPRLNDEGRRALAVVRSEARRMGRLIDDLLMFSRLGRKDVQKRETDMTLLAREVFAELRPDAADGDVELCLADLPPAMCDPSLIHQVWANLLGNAMKFTRRRAGATIEVSGSVQGTESVYIVKDNGVGFDMRYSDKLFGVFQRLHGSDEFEGTGVGLALVQRVVSRHGGRVWAEGEVGRGASFFFSLPVVPERNA